MENPKKTLLQEFQKRKRGRPAGRGRAALSQAERRARNAQYERERRQEMTEAFGELAEAARLPRNMAISNLISIVIKKLKKAKDVKKIELENKILEKEIKHLEDALVFGEDEVPDLKEDMEVSDAEHCETELKDTSDTESEDTSDTESEDTSDAESDGTFESRLEERKRTRARGQGFKGSTSSDYN